MGLPKKMAIKMPRATITCLKSTQKFIYISFNIYKRVAKKVKILYHSSFVSTNVFIFLNRIEDFNTEVDHPIHLIFEIKIPIISRYEGINHLNY